MTSPPGVTTFSRVSGFETPERMCLPSGEGVGFLFSVHRDGGLMSWSPLAPYAVPICLLYQSVKLSGRIIGRARASRSAAILNNGAARTPSPYLVIEPKKFS